MNRKIIHAADIHLDSPLQKLSQYEGAPAEQIRRASRNALTKLVDLAIEESVDLLVIAGDLYDVISNRMLRMMFLHCFVEGRGSKSASGFGPEGKYPLGHR